MKKSFTLVELLVVIAIVGGLSGFFLPNLMSAREKARDTQRKSDLKQIQKALELYRQNHNPPLYPTPITCGNATCFPGSGNKWQEGNVVYMNKIPKDPNRTDNNGFYYYSVDNNTLTYTLCACLENSADPEANGTHCQATYSGYTCSSGKAYIVNEP